MDKGFQFEVIYRDNDMLELRVTGWNGAFAGKTNVYVATGELEETAAALRGFPTNPADSRQTSFGNFGPKTARGGVRMCFYCSDGTGHSHVEARFESDYNSSGKAESALFVLPIEAAAMDLFVDELYNLGQRRNGTAFLRGKN